MKISNKLWRRALLSITAGLFISQSAITYAARCEYTIQNEWGSGFVAAVRITNDTNTAINGWSVNWSYNDGSKKTGGWNANFSGTNPYAASGVGWNDRINPGQTIEFGVQGNKGVANSPAVKPVVNGTVCGGNRSSSVASSSVPSSTSFSSSSRTSPSSSSSRISVWGCNDHTSCAASTSSRLSSISSSSYPSSSSSYPSSSSSSSGLYCPQGNSWPDCPYYTWSDAYCAAHSFACPRSSSSTPAATSSSSSKISSSSGGQSSSSISSNNYSSSSTSSQIECQGPFCNTSSSALYRSSSSSSSITSSASTSSSSSSSSLIWSCIDNGSSCAAFSSVGSSVPNISPVPDLRVTTHGLTVYVDTTGSVDADGNPLTHTIDFGEGETILYPQAWHTYSHAGDYSIVISVSDGRAMATKTQQVTVAAAAGNQAPIARLTTSLEYRGSISAKGSSSFDVEGTPLTFEWDFGEGSFSDDASINISACGSGSSSSRVSSSSAASSSMRAYKLITLTVSDGELKDTIQRYAGGGDCGIVYDVLPQPEFSYAVDGNKVSVDARASRDDISFSWDFGDGTVGSGLLASHTYASSGTYDIKLYVAGPSLFSNSITKSVVVGSVSSSSAISFSSISSSPSWGSSSSRSTVATSRSSFSTTSSSEASRQYSSVRSSSSQGSSDRNRYIAPRATTAPIIDGVVDSVWDRASWAPIDMFWLGTQSNPSAQDYSGRYKALWDENYLYVLYDITDDRIYDGVRDALDRYWEDDTVELFIDENKSGGQHGYNTNAWAYHISTYGDVVDSTTGGAKLLNDHIDSRLVSNGSQHYWELRVRIYGEDYADWKSNTPLQLYAGKLMGFSACYIDNDGSSQRESMMGSVDTQGHKNNQGYLDASVFGSLLLVE